MVVNSSICDTSMIAMNLGTIGMPLSAARARSTNAKYVSGSKKGWVRRTAAPLVDLVSSDSECRSRGPALLRIICTLRMQTFDYPFMNSTSFAPCGARSVSGRKPLARPWIAGRREARSRSAALRSSRISVSSTAAWTTQVTWAIARLGLSS